MDANELDLLEHADRNKPFRLSGGSGDYVLTANEVNWINIARDALPQLVEFARVQLAVVTRLRAAAEKALTEWERFGGGNSSMNPLADSSFGEAVDALRAALGGGTT